MDQDSEAIWDAYNLLLLGPDVERLRKLLVRHYLFQLSLDIPGDIVECGVFKGAGLMLWLKLLHIYAPGSAKRVIGFDTFGLFAAGMTPQEALAAHDLIVEAHYEGLDPRELYQRVEDAGISRERCELIAGDIRQTAEAYVTRNPGFRISLLHLDLDLEEATFAALEAFWPRVVVGGVVIFDEYAISRWTESNAVDRFFVGKSVQIKTLHWARTPTAYAIKGTL